MGLRPWGISASCAKSTRDRSASAVRMSTVRSFTDDLAMSDQPAVVEAIKAACYAVWPELLGVTRAHKVNDRLGCDYWLEFRGKNEALDVKVRTKDWALHGDDRTACLELLSNVGTNKPGWTIDPDKLTDWVMFYYVESGSYVVYNARQLRAAVVRYLPDLERLGKPAVQSTGGYSGGYKSTSLFVSHRELGAAIYRNSQHIGTPLALAA